jgi:hypothetical protein
MLPFFKIVVNENDETGIDFNSFVDAPAHMKAFIAFGKNPVRYEFNEEKRIVTGVMISAGTPIYRNSPDMGEYYVVFDAPTIDLIRRKFFKNGFIQNVNKQHNSKDVIKGATLIDSYIVSNSDPKLPNVPEAFTQMNLQDGSWIASYYVEDNVLWDDVKSGKFVGFSVEGWFEKKQIKVKTKMSKQNKTLWESIKEKFNDAPAAPEVVEVTFSEATTAEGTVVFYDGELAEGTLLTIELDSVKVPAPEGEHQLTLEDGTVKVVTLDGTGAIVSIVDAMEEATEEVPVELSAEVAEVLAKTIKGVDAKFAEFDAELKAFKKENETLKAEIETFKSSGKFGANPKKVEEQKQMTASEILKMKNK